VAREIHALLDSNDPEQLRIWLEELRQETNNLIKRARESCLSTYAHSIDRTVTTINMHGDLLSVSTADAINPTPTTYTVDVGNGKLVFALIAGSDVSGSIIVTGTQNY
jgi:hypothetical protein